MAAKVVLPGALGRNEVMATILEQNGCELLRLPAPEPGVPFR